jgi:hypothetical protein
VLVIGGNLGWYGPLAGGMVMGGLAVALRYTYGTGRPPRREPVQRSGDYGLLEPVATVRTRQDALLLRDLLSSHALRATTARAPGRAWHVLVFSEDIAAARELIAARS